MIGPARTSRAWLTAALAVGLALRLGFALLYWVDKPLTHDEREYLLLAYNLKTGAGFTYGDEGTPGTEAGRYQEGGNRALAAGDSSGAGVPAGEMLPPERFGRVPLYPLFIAAVVPASHLAPPLDVVPTSLKIAQAFVGVLGVWVIARVARRAAGERAYVATAWSAAIYPPLAWFCAYALSETLYTLLVFSAVLALGRVTDHPADEEPVRNSRRLTTAAAAAGVLAGIATLTRPAALFFLPLACLYLLYRRQLLLAVVLAVSAVAVVVPWSIRNAIVHGRLVPVSSQGGITFWTGNHRLAIGEGDMAANPDIKRANLDLRRQYPDRSPEALEPVYWREAFLAIAADPLWWIGLELRKAFYTLVPVGPSYRLHSPLYFGASLVSYGVLLPLGLAGLLELRRRATQPRALWLLAASAVLVCLVFFPQERFRVPVLDPTLIVCAGAWLAARTEPVRASG